MSIASSPAQPANPWAGRAVWLLKFLLAGAFIAAAWLKLSGNPKMVTEFGVIGLGQGFRYATGVIEAAGGVLLLLPATSFFGSLILLGICAGALVAQLGPLHGDLVHVFVLGALLFVTAWLSRPDALRGAR